MSKYIMEIISNLVTKTMVVLLVVEVAELQQEQLSLAECVKSRRRTVATMNDFFC